MDRDRFIQVILPLKLDWEPYYRLPEGMEAGVGSRVRVLFSGAFYVGCVSSVDVTPELELRRILPVQAVETALPAVTAEEILFWRKTADYYLCTVGEVYKAAYPSERNRKSKLTLPETAPLESAPLSPEQEAWADAIRKADKTVLLNGPHRWDVYLKLADETLRAGRSVLILTPENAPSREVPSALLYNRQITAGKRKAVAEKLRTGEPALVLGTRTALFLPFSRLGLVIVDEEQDAGYKQDAPAPRYHARESAIMLAGIHGAKVVLGSATPSLESIYNARCGRFTEVAAGTVGAQSPKLEMINIAAEARKKGMAGLFSLKLLAAIRDTLDSGLQVLLLGPRRIYEQGKRLEDEVLEYLPEARVANLEQGPPDDEYDIYLGSILGTRGFRCEKLGLVAITSCDGILSRQDFRADEKAFQILSLYRGLSPRFVVQTREVGHPVFRLMSRDANPVEMMLQERSIAGYPPYTRLVKLQLKDSNEKRLNYLSKELAAAIGTLGVRLEGPYTPAQEEDCREMLVVLQRDRELVKRKAAIGKTAAAFEQDRKYSGHIVIDVDPV